MMAVEPNALMKKGLRLSPVGYVHRLLCVEPNALMKKGLRHIPLRNRLIRGVEPNALMKKGLRRGRPGRFIKLLSLNRMP